jgi:glucose-6-phosphate 1-epimerase
MSLFLPACARLSERENIGTVLTLSSAASTAEVALCGATVISFAPNGQRPVLWLSKTTSSAGNKPLRGGIPVCAPWFGPHPTASAHGAPYHGVVRTKVWTITRVEELESGAVRATLEVEAPRDLSQGWNHDAQASLVVTVGTTLSIELSVRNTGSDSFLLSNGLHTYFAVSDVRGVRVEGLENTEYLAFAADGRRRMHGEGPVVMKGEAADMFYTGRPVRLVDETWHRAIDIKGHGAATTIVWNPWETTGMKAGDIGSQWPEFICVENANIADVAVPLAPNTSYHTGTDISVSAL